MQSLKASLDASAKECNSLGKRTRNYLRVAAGLTALWFTGNTVSSKLFQITRRRAAHRAPGTSSAAAALPAGTPASVPAGYASGQHGWGKDSVVQDAPATGKSQILESAGDMVGALSACAYAGVGVLLTYGAWLWFNHSNRMVR